MVLAVSGAAVAQEKDSELDAILSLDIAQLTVTSVALREQKLNDTASAIYVLTAEDLKRMGVTSIPEALRAVPGVDVAQTRANGWTVSARGFNGALANKMQFLIDGRSAFTPILSTTYWDDQAVPIENIERIEVIRGSSGTLYGSNSVNGVINIITKKAKDMQGNLAKLGIGTEERVATARHGGKGENAGTYFSTYVQLRDTGSTARPVGGQNADDWWQARSGFRVDSRKGERDTFTVQGDAFGGNFDSESNLFQATPPYALDVQTRESSYGGNVLGRWKHDTSADSQWEMQAYIDHYNRSEAVAVQSITKMDVSLKHNKLLNDRNRLIWGGGYRYTFESINDSFSAGILTDNVERHLANVFVQDEYAVIPDEMTLIVGSKFEHNSFTGFEVQPNARLSWQFSRNQMVWGAVSRNVRTPSEAEDQGMFVLGVNPLLPQAFGIGRNSDPGVETLIAYELGHRLQATRNLYVDTSLFYNDYDNLIAFGAPVGPFIRQGIPTVALPFVNLGKGQTYGVEIAANWNVAPNWRLSGGYTYTEMVIDTRFPGTAPFYD